MFRLGLIMGVLVVSSSALACDQLDDPSSNESLLLRSDSGSGFCISIEEGLAFASEQVDVIASYFETEETSHSSYWSEWVLNSENSPILSKSISSNYVGLGVWVPNELEEELSDMDAEQWLMSHGLQLSLGFGEKKSGEPRMRFDYRWHDSHEADVMMQLELPF